MISVLTSSIFWHGIIDLMITIAIISGRPKNILDALAARQLNQT